MKGIHSNEFKNEKVYIDYQYIGLKDDSNNSVDIQFFQQKREIHLDICITARKNGVRLFRIIYMNLLEYCREQGLVGYIYLEPVTSQGSRYIDRLISIGYNFESISSSPFYKKRMYRLTVSPNEFNDEI